jgi:hypothetical protein
MTCVYAQLTLNNIDRVPESTMTFQVKYEKTILFIRTCYQQ